MKSQKNNRIYFLTNSPQLDFFPIRVYNFFIRR
jgi:hypothetical protein